MPECSKVEPHRPFLSNEAADRLDSDGNPFPPISVWLNAGYDKGSYACEIMPSGMLTLPDGLVRELSIEIGDDIEWNLNEETGTIYVKVIRQPWQQPSWIDDDTAD